MLQYWTLSLSLRHSAFTIDKELSPCSDYEGCYFHPCILDSDGGHLLGYSPWLGYPPLLGYPIKSIPGFNPVRAEIPPSLPRGDGSLPRAVIARIVLARK